MIQRLAVFVLHATVFIAAGVLLAGPVVRAMPQGELSAASPGQQGQGDGYRSYVSQMDEAESVRLARETLSWASVGSSWMMVPATPSPTSSPEQASPDATTESKSTDADEAPRATEALSSLPSSTTPSSNGLRLGLGIGIPLGLLASGITAAAIIHEKRKAFRREFDKRTAALRQMSQVQA